MTERPTPLPETSPNWSEGLRRRIPYYLLGSILLAILAGVLTFVYLDQLRRNAMPSQSVVVAATELKPGIEITEGMVELRSAPDGVIPGNAVHQVGDALGRVLAGPIMANEILQSSDFIGESGAGLSARLPDGRWAVVLPATWLASPLPSLQNSDRIDLLAYLPGQPIAEAGVIVSAVEVLETRGTAASPDQLVLAVSLEDATAVLYSRANGFFLWALLRSQSR